MTEFLYSTDELRRALSNIPAGSTLGWSIITLHAISDETSVSGYHVGHDAMQAFMAAQCDYTLATIVDGTPTASARIKEECSAILTGTNWDFVFWHPANLTEPNNTFSIDDVKARLKMIPFLQGAPDFAVHMLARKCATVESVFLPRLHRIYEGVVDAGSHLSLHKYYGAKDLAFYCAVGLAGKGIYRYHAWYPYFVQVKHIFVPTYRMADGGLPMATPAGTKSMAATRLVEVQDFFKNKTIVPVSEIDAIVSEFSRADNGIVFYNFVTGMPITDNIDLRVAPLAIFGLFDGVPDSDVAVRDQFVIVNPDSGIIELRKLNDG